MARIDGISRRNFFKLGGGVAALAVLAGCSKPAAKSSAGGSGSGAAKTLTVGASPTPHAEILTKFAAPALEKQGITLKVVEYTDYILPNKDTETGKVDANYFQHINYLNNYNEKNGTSLVNAGKVHFEPMGVFVGKTKDLASLADGATIAVPNDPTNEGRALLLLQDKGLITLKAEAGITATVKDIADNPKNLKFSEQEAAAVPRTLQDVDLAIVNGNYALAAGLKLEDAVAHEDPKSDVIQKEYANIIATTQEKEQDELVLALVKVLQTQELKDYLKNTYGDAVLPVF